MSSIATFLTVMWLSTATAQLGIVTDLAKSVGKEVVAVADPVEMIVIAVGSSQCSNVKRIFGVDYDSNKNDEPDLSKLTINFITREITIIYNLTDAAELIPRSKWFNPNRLLKIYLHGFIGDPNNTSSKKIINAYLDKGDYNIVALDASSMIHWMYLRATTLLSYIGERLAQVLAAMTSAGLDASNIHLIGHSLGGHIAGFTGKTYTELTNKKVSRITGLDPAGPCYAKLNQTLRLNFNDAVFVDVIHTDAGGFGLNVQVGHVDFYPNDGSEQPNCFVPTCSHSRACVFCAESVVNSTAFIGVKCNSWDDFKKGNCDFHDTRLMGYACPADARGRYYLQTGQDDPFGRGVDGLTYVNQDAIVKNVLDSLS